MPRLTPSKGIVTFKTVFPDEFQRWLCYELENSKQWNPETTSGGLTGTGWKYRFISKKDHKYDWRIEYQRDTGIVCYSGQPKIWIRQGLSISMGKARIEIEGNTP